MVTGLAIVQLKRMFQPAKTSTLEIRHCRFVLSQGLSKRVRDRISLSSAFNEVHDDLTIVGLRSPNPSNGQNVWATAR